MNQLKVRLVFAFFVWSGPLEVLRLSQVVVVQLGLEALVRGLGEHALLFHDGQNTHRLQRERGQVM